MGIAGLAGGIVGAILAEVISRPDSIDAPFADNPAMATTLFTVLIAIGIGGVLASWDGIQARAQRRLASLAFAVPVLVVCGAVAGSSPRFVYEPMVKGSLPAH